MHVLMISDGETEGGAAVAASRLAATLCREGHRVTRFVNYGDGLRHEWKTICLCPDIRTRLKRRITQFPVRSQMAGRNLREIIRKDPPEVIHVHNIHDSIKDGWTLGLLEIACAAAPTFWSLHDMWSFTGGCPYAPDQAQAAPGSASCYASEPGFSWKIWRKQERLMETHSNLAAIAPSRWMQREAQAGLWRGRPVHPIPYGLPLDLYEPLDRALARKALGISADRPVLMFAAVKLSDARKGGALLRVALERLAGCSPQLLLMGNGELEIDAPHIRQTSLGYVANDRMKALAYCAADLFVHPALMDNLPIVVMEAIACGTPVVGFPIGGMPDMVHSDRTGWLASEVSAEALSAAIMEALARISAGDDLRASCRAFAETHWSDPLQAERCLNLFQSTLRGDGDKTNDRAELMVDAA